MTEGKNTYSEEYIISDSGSTIANVNEVLRGRRGFETLQNREEKTISDSGSTIASINEDLRGRRGFEKLQNREEKTISDSGSTIANINEVLRGRRGLDHQRNHSSHRVLSDYDGEYFNRGDNPADIIVIRGQQYKIIRILSDSTAEARVLLIEKENQKYALKLYHHDLGHRANKKILQLIKDNEKPGIIKIYDFGEMRNGYNPYERADYELLEYCEGGALKAGELYGNNDELEDVALGMIIAAVSCEDLGFIHRDIKPQNFLWADKAHTRLVLSDFGFAVPCPQGEQVRVEDHRTIIYTAPEFYLRAPGMPPKISAASDMYSVGISMLTLWSGEDVMMGMTETQQIEMKSRELLPYPADMNPKLMELLKGLTYSRPDLRWDFERIRAWVTEDPDQNIQEQLNKEFEIIFDPAENLVAYNRGELAGLMLQNQATAIRLLYSGMAEYWIEEAGFFEEAVTLHEITESLYPGKEQQVAGLWAAIYTLAPYAPYFFPGSSFKNPESDIIASDIADLTQKIWDNIFHSNNFNLKFALKEEIRNPDSPLAVYLTWQGHGDTIAEARKLSGNTSVADEEILWLLYSLNDSLPLYLDGNIANSLGEIMEVVPRNNNRPFTIFKSETFVKWLFNRDIMLSSRVKEIIDKGGSENDVYAALINALLRY